MKPRVLQESGRGLTIELNNNYCRKIDDCSFKLVDTIFNKKDFIHKNVNFGNGEIIKTNTKINDFKIVDNYKVEIIEFALTDCSTYLTPFLELNPKITCSAKNKLFFTNSYLSEDLKSLYVVYKWNNSDNYNTLEQHMESSSYYQETIKVDRFNVYKFKTEHFENIIKTFLDGKFIEFKTIDKNIILDYWYWDYPGNYAQTCDTARILYNCPEYRKVMSEYTGCNIPDNMSLKSIPDKNKEIWERVEPFKNY